MSGDTKINLCDSCVIGFPECGTPCSDITFGDAIGDDNVCACKRYIKAE